MTKPDTAENLTRPVGKVRRKLDVVAITGTYTMDDTLYGSKHTWYFSLDDNLRVIIQFDKIEIVYMNIKDCTIGKVNMESHGLFSKSLYSTHFCGSYPIVTVVPPFQMTEIVVWAMYRVKYDVAIFYSVIDVNISYSYDTKMNYSAALYWSYCFPKSSIISIKYFIKVEKYNHILIKILYPGMDVNVQDGPGPSSPLVKREMKTSETDADGTFFKTSGFQCFLTVNIDKRIYHDGGFTLFQYYKEMTGTFFNYSLIRNETSNIYNQKIRIFNNSLQRLYSIDAYYFQNGKSQRINRYIDI